MSLSHLPPLSLYVHLPWCVRKCPYCDFNSYRAAAEIPERSYVDALVRDLDQDLPRVAGRRLHSIFLGGGTPSLFSPESIDRLLSAVRARLPFEGETEVTLEANPGTVDAGRFRGFRAAGVNRLSIGVQSFAPEKLRALGRIHGREEALRAMDAARAAGFENVNLDLMYGLPAQTGEQALADLATAVALGPEHLSLYELTIEPNTVFQAKPPPLPDDDARWEMQLPLQALLADYGYRQYEVSAYARGERRCRHNLNYWEFGDYLGVGAGAHAKLSDADGVTRLWKLKQPQAYMKQSGTRAGIGGVQRLGAEDLAFEFLLNALRLTEGFDPSLFERRTGLPLSFIGARLQTAQHRGFLACGAQRIVPTATGRRLLNELLLLFLPPEEPERRRAAPTGVARVQTQPS